MATTSNIQRRRRRFGVGSAKAADDGGEGDVSCDVTSAFND
jgi:hypothetical protein